MTTAQVFCSNHVPLSSTNEGEHSTHPIKKEKKEKRYYAFNIKNILFKVVCVTGNLPFEIASRLTKIQVDYRMYASKTYYGFSGLEFSSITRIWDVLDESELSFEEYKQDDFCSEYPLIVYAKQKKSRIIPEELSGITPQELDEKFPCAHKCLNIGKLVAIMAFGIW